MTVIQTSKGLVKIWDKYVPMDANTIDQLRKTADLPFIHKWIAAMPDAHLGKGATVGSVIATRKAIIPAAVGVDLGCFSAETKVDTLNGSFTMKELFERDEPFYVFSYCHKTKFINAAKATAMKTRSDAQLIQVELDNGELIDCTPDHKFMLRDGSYKEAQHLEVDESLMPLYTKSDKDGYLKVLQPVYSNSYYQRAHWLVARSLIPDLPDLDSDEWVIHHIDHNIHNNNPENLQFMTRSEHCTYHFQKRKHSFWQTESFEAKRLQAVRAYFNDPKNYEAIRNRATKNILSYMSNNYDEWKEKIKDNGKRGSKYLGSYNVSEEGRAKSKEVGSRLYTCSYCERTVKSPGGFAAHERKCKQTHNHKVVGIKQLDDLEDVYCLNVPQYGNFALSAGVFVHNCGMLACKTSLTANQLPDDLKPLRLAIEQLVPVGQGKHAKNFHEADYEYLGRTYQGLDEDLNTNGLAQLGTLGGGNHFIEICLDEHDNVWIMLHSGSRGVGNAIGRKYIDLAKQEMEKYYITLPDADLAYLPQGTPLFDRYIAHLNWAQEYAATNRQVMLSCVEQAIDSLISDVTYEESVINCHHNYTQLEHHYGHNVYVTRKGAISARKGEMGIIPGSMGTKSYIVRGLGNEESFHSCSHGAGRVMSRTQAKREVSMADHLEAIKGVECRKDDGLLDETPSAYKNIDDVMASQTDLVEIVATLKQIMCIKG